MVKVEKRDGRIVDFDKTKISNAIIKAMKNGNSVKENIAVSIADDIEEFFKDKEVVKINEIELEVFNRLIAKKQKMTAKSYEDYRSVREFQRESNTIDKNIMGLFDGSNKEMLSENSNKNEHLISTSRDLVAEEVSKDYAKRKMLTPDIVTAINEGIIYVHDLGHYMNKSHNCIDDMAWIDVRINGKVDRIQLRDLYSRYEIEPNESGVVKELDDKVYVKDNKGWTRIKAVMARKTKKDEVIYSFKTLNGHTLKCTGNHRIPVLRDGKAELVFAKDIKKTDCMFIIELNNDLIDIVTVSNKNEENVSVEGFEKLPSTKIISITESVESSIVVDIETESNYFVANDYLVHNCCLVNLKDMLDNGTCINRKLIESPHRFITACTIATQIAAQVASGQFGGQTMTLTHLAPYLRKSKIRLDKEVREELDGQVSEDVINKIVDKRLHQELEAGVQTFNYQLNTLQSSNGFLK